MTRHGRRTLTSKLSRLFFGVLTLVALLIFSVVLLVNTNVERQRLASIEAQVRANIDSHGRVLIDNHELALRALVADNAFTDVRALVEGAVEHDVDIVYGVFVSADGTPWAYAGPDVSPVGEADTKHLESWVALPLEPGSWKSGQQSRRTVRAFGEEVVQLTRPIIADGEVLGMVAYGFGTQSLQHALASVQQESKQTLHQMLSWIALAVLTSTLLGFVLVRRVAQRISVPLRVLTAATDRIAAGEHGVRVRVDSGDELEVLAGAFNHMQAANEDAMNKLSTATEAALEASRLKSEFLANMSHEIRTPMNGVMGMTRLLLDLPLESKIRRYVETVDKSASALMTIINDVLDFSKMEAGKYELHDSVFEPESVVREVVELLAGRAFDKQLELVYRKSEDVPSFCVSDPDRYRQILNNLVGNAIKFAAEGEVLVELTVERSEGDDFWLRTVVQDTGIGIADQDIAKLFTAFSQVDGSMVRQHGGTGLGLAISKRLAEMMGGSIGVESELGVGSRFWFTVRVKRSAQESGLTPVTIPRGRRVLVIEPSRGWGDILREHLLAWGLECRVFEHGQAALDAVSRADQPYDLAVVGAGTQDLPLATLVERLREQERGARLPIIALTRPGASAMLSHVEQELAAQVSKPLRLSELHDCIVGVFAGSGPNAPRPRAAQRAVRNRGKRILVVDDNDINQFVASEQILAAGFEVDAACNGAEAVAKIKANRYSAVLMDCQMPVMDGYSAAREIRAWEADGRHVPIIALTAHAMAGEREKVLAAGMDDYLAKPLRANALERMLDRYVGKGASAGKSEVGDVANGGKEKRSPEPVDLDMAIERSRRLVELFASLVPENLEQLDHAIEKSAAPEVRSWAHKLKGSCLAIGAEVMAREAEALQFEAENDDLRRAEERAVALWAQYDRVLAALSLERRDNDTAGSRRTSAEQRFSSSSGAVAVNESRPPAVEGEE